MGQRQNQFQISETRSWSGKTLPFTLGGLFTRDPKKAFDVVTKVFAANNIPDRYRELSKYKSITVDTPDEQVTWDLIGSPYANVELVEARMGNTTVTASHTVGIGGAKFKLIFPEPKFGMGEIIIGKYGEKYLIRILSDALYEGTQVIYEAELFGVSKNTGIPGSLLLKGERFVSEDYHPTTLIRSDMKGTLGGAMPFKMKQELSTVRLDYTVPGIELNRKLNIALPVGKNDELVNMIVPYKDWLFENRFTQGIGKAILYGRSNRDENGIYRDKDTNGEIIRMGAGIREQMQVSNTFIYDVFSIQFVNDALYNMTAGKMEIGPQTFELVTGKKGAELFHKAVMDVASGWHTANGQFGGNGNINTIKQTTSELHSNALAAGFQFTEFKAPCGVYLKVTVDPTYDDVTRNMIFKDNNPNNGPAESYRFDIYYRGKVDDDYNNVVLVKVKGQEEGIRGYTSGPFGNLWEDARAGNKYASTTKDEYGVHKIMSFGAVIKDPTRTMTLLPPELAHTI